MTSKFEMMNRIGVLVHCNCKDEHWTDRIVCFTSALTSTLVPSLKTSRRTIRTCLLSVPRMAMMNPMKDVSSTVSLVEKRHAKSSPILSQQSLPILRLKILSSHQNPRSLCKVCCSFHVSVYLSYLRFTDFMFSLHLTSS